MIYLTSIPIVLALLAVPLYFRWKKFEYDQSFQIALTEGTTCRFALGHDFGIGIITRIDGYSVIIVCSATGEAYNLAIDQIRPI